MEPDDLLPFLGWIIGGGLALGAMGILASFQTTRMKIKNGYPLEGMWGQSLKSGSITETAHRVTLLPQENSALRAELGAMKGRLANVERIVSVGGYQLGAEIDALRERALSNLRDKGEA